MYKIFRQITSLPIIHAFYVIPLIHVNRVAARLIAEKCLQNFRVQPSCLHNLLTLGQEVRGCLWQEERIELEHNKTLKYTCTHRHCWMAIQKSCQNLIVWEGFSFWSLTCDLEASSHWAKVPFLNVIWKDAH